MLSACILNSSCEQLKQAAHDSSRHDPEKISADDIRKLLTQIGGASDFDAQKVIGLLAVDGKVFRHKMISLLEEALQDARFSSQAVQKFNSALLNSGVEISESFLRKDINKDGQLNQDGFRSGLMDAGDLQSFGVSLADLKEIFNLVSTGSVFSYADYIMDVNPATRAIFQKHNILPSEASRLEQSSLTLGGIDESIRHADTIRPIHDPAMSKACESARQKIEQYMVSQQVSLSVLFNVMDTNSDRSLGKAEFKQKIRGLHINLAEEEMEAMFTDLDKDKNGSISYMEFIKQFAAVNTAQIVQRMRKILYGASISAEYIFNKHCGSQMMSQKEFEKLLEQLVGKLATFELESIFRQLADKTQDHKTTFIRKDKFLDWFGYDEQEKLFQVGIEDIIKPLITIMERKNLRAPDIYDKYDQNRNQMLSANELAEACKEMLRFDMGKDEIKTLHEFFKAKFKRAEIKKAEFAELLNKVPVRKWDKKSAKAALSMIKGHLDKRGREIEQVLAPQKNPEFATEMTLRGFKVCIYSLNQLTQQQVNNLARYMDRRNNGMILISDLKTALVSDNYNPGAPTGPGQVKSARR